MTVKTETESLLGTGAEHPGSVLPGVTGAHEHNPSPRTGEELLRFALDTADVGWWDMNLGDRRTQRALRHDQIFGYEALQEDWTYQRFLEHVLPSEREKVATDFEQALSTDKLWDVECRIRRPDGVERHIWIKTHSRQMNDGKVVRMMGIIGDHTQRKHDEQVMQDSAARLRLLDAIGEATRTASDPVVIMETTTRLLGEHLGASRCAYADVEADNDRFTIRHDWTVPGVASSVGDYSLTLFGVSAAGQLQRGATLKVDDVDRDLSPDGAAMFTSIGIKALVCCPLVSGEELRGLMAVHSAMPRVWSPIDVALVEAVAERSWAHIERVRAQIVLRNNEARLDDLLATAPGIIWTADADGEVAYVSRWFRVYTGKTDGSFLMPDWPQFIHPEDLPGVLEAWTSCIERSVPYARVFRIRRHDGVYRWHTVSSVPVFDANGALRRWSGLGFDIHEQKETADALGESEGRFRDMADHISQLAWMADSEGKVFWYNRRWYDYSGTTFEQVAGTGWTLCHHPDHVDRVVAKVTSCFANGEIWEDLFPLRGADGRFRWFLSRAQPIRDDSGKVVRWFGTNTDVDDQLVTEEALRDADKRKDEFLATLAHELRNPLAPIRNALELMRLAPEDQRLMGSARGMMERQIGQMIHLVDDLLDLSRVSRGIVELRRKRMPISDALRSAIEMSKPLIDESGHTLRVLTPDEPLEVDADPTRLAQIFANLLNNAAKFTPQNGYIMLSLERDGDDHALITVRDNGKGIEPLMLDRVFDMFTQAERSQMRVGGGLGIGLTLVRSLVEMHGGTVFAHSDGTGAGSAFTVRLPLAAGVDEASSTASKGSTVAENSETEGHTGAMRRILVADDNVDSAESLSMMLELLGNETRMAHDGEQALVVAAEFRPQVMLLDIGMPRLDGHATAKRVRAESWGRDVMLIALSGWGQNEDKRRSIEAGFDHHLVKPLDLPTLEALLEAQHTST